MATGEIARSVLQRLEDAWNAGDGGAYGAHYQDTASFVNIHGDRSRGAEAITAGHSYIFATIYAGSTNRIELVDAHRLSDDVIVSTSRNTLDVPHGPLAGVHQAMSTTVLVRDGEEWRIAVTHNTLVGAR
jgi:uncharacterized protein (TIGR02246 family)